MRDKDEKDIYEGDILKTELTNGIFRSYQVVWRDAGFHLDMMEIGYTPLAYIDKNRIEVCDNIHDNPGLTEGGAGL